MRRRIGPEHHEPAWLDVVRSDVQDEGGDTELERSVSAAFRELELNDADRRIVTRYLSILRGKHEPSYEDSLEVGLLCRRIAQQEKLDEKTMLVSGLLHDIGKALVPKALLEKKVGWSDEDREQMRKHVVHGFELTKDTSLGIVPDIIARTHGPVDPSRQQEYSADWDEETKERIEQYAQYVSLADVYDALHRDNDRYAKGRALSGEEIREKLLELKPEQQELIESLYGSGIFTLKRGEAQQAA